MVEGVFLSPEPYHFQRREGLKSPLLSVILLRDKYPLHIINEMLSVVGPLKDLLYIY
jgi:hypothetical protein